MLSLRYSFKEIELSQVSSMNALKCKETDGGKEFSVWFSETDAEAFTVKTKMNSMVFQAMELEQERLDGERKFRYEPSVPDHDVIRRFEGALCVIHWPAENDRRIFLANNGDPDCEIAGYQLRELMFRDGFRVGGRRFVPLLSGAGMTREAKYLFVAQPYRDGVLNRITNGIVRDGSRLALEPDCKVSLSKLLAYIGLADSDGQSLAELAEIERIERNRKEDGKSGFDEEAIDINENTVVVVKDVHGKMRHDAFRYMLKNDIQDGGNVTLQEMTDKDKGNLTDGYGFICPEWAAQINRMRKCRKADDPDRCAFIIRLPLVKGVALQCDFREYLERHGVTEITDIYSRKVPLSCVKMILTESMFKGHKLFEYTEGNVRPKKETWAEYCDRLKQYGLSMIITGGNTVNEEEQQVRLNYQVISSLQPDEKETMNLIAPEKALQDELEKLIRGRQEDETEQAYAEKVVRYLERSAEESETNEDDGGDGNGENENDGGTDGDGTEPKTQDGESEDETDDKDGETEETEGGYARTLAALVRLNPALTETDLVRNELKSARLKQAMELGKGRPLVNGVKGMLIGDPFVLLNSIWERDGKDFDRQENDLAVEKQGFVYIPELDRAGSGSPAVNEAVLLRNPHLSVLEAIPARMLHAQEDENAQKYRYRRYFGQHRGIVIVPQVVAAGLSGADYDGDRCKAVTDPVLVNLVKANREKIFELLKKSGDPDFRIDPDPAVKTDNLNLPIVCIQPFATQNLQAGDINGDFWGKVLDSHTKSLQSRIGIFSMKAAKLAMNYGMFSAVDPDDGEARKAALDVLRLLGQMTVTVGLEIDSAKTGVTPEEPKLGQIGRDCKVIAFSRAAKKNKGKYQGEELYRKALEAALYQSDSKTSGEREKLNGTPAGSKLVTEFAFAADGGDTPRRRKTEHPLKAALGVAAGNVPQEVTKKATALLKAAGGRKSAVAQITKTAQWISDRREDIQSYLLQRYPLGTAYRLFAELSMACEADPKRKLPSLTNDKEAARYAFMTCAEREAELKDLLFSAGGGAGLAYTSDVIQLVKAVNRLRGAQKQHADAIVKKQTNAAAPMLTQALKQKLQDLAGEHFSDLGAWLLSKDKINEMQYLLLFGEDLLQQMKTEFSREEGGAERA